MKTCFQAKPVPDFGDFAKGAGIEDCEELVAVVAKAAWNAAIESAVDAFVQNEGTDFELRSLLEE